MSHKEKLTAKDIKFLLIPKRSRNSSQSAKKNERQKNNQREIENALKGMPEADVILNQKQTLRVKISQIKSSMKPDSVTFIGEKISRLEERLAEATFIEENYEQVISFLQQEIGNCNDNLAAIYSRVTLKVIEEEEKERENNSQQ